jgi:tetratricopeptide (TPR) repeat protein
VLARQGELELARARLLLALERNEAFAPSHTLLAKVNARLGRWQEAQQSAQRAAELAPEQETVQALLPAIQRAQLEAAAAQLRRQEQVRGARSAALERYAAQHETEMALAFGAGVGLAALFGLGMRILLGGGKKRHK